MAKNLTPAWLAEEVKGAGVVIGRHHLIVGAFDLAQLRAFLDGYAKSVSGTTWEEVAAKLARLGRWEFEDFVPYHNNYGIARGGD